MQKKGANISLKGYDDIFSTDQSRAEAQQERVQEIPLSELHPFEGHPFRVVDDEEMMKTAESVRDFGVLTPAIVRPDPDGGYEIVSGHRRHRASELAGKETMPAIVRDLDDDAAIILMVDANLQRESILPSERAFAYKMKLEAIKRQGARTDLTFCQVGERITSSQVGKKLSSSQIVTGTSDKDGTKLENPTLQTHSLTSGHDADGKWVLLQDKSVGDAIIRSNQALAMQTGESQRQISRYIRLTNLIPKILDMVDDGKIAFTIAVELSYLTEEQQYELYEVMEMEQCTPSLSQANRMKRMSQSGNLDMDAMFSILEQEKPNQREQIKLRADSVAKYFPEDYTPKQKMDLIEQLLKEWYEKHEHEKTHSSDSSRGRAR